MLTDTKHKTNLILESGYFLKLFARPEHSSQITQYVVKPFSFKVIKIKEEVTTALNKIGRKKVPAVDFIDD